MRVDYDHWPSFLALWKLQSNLLREMATFSLVRADGPYIPGSDFNLSTSTTFPQRQWPLKRVPTATTYTTFRVSRPWQQLVDRLINTEFKTLLFIVEGHDTWSVPRVSGLCCCLLLLFYWYILIALRIYMLQSDHCLHRQIRLKKHLLQTRNKTCIFKTSFVLG